MTTHEVKFYTRRTPADAKARCTCGWFTMGSLDECQTAAAVHDTEWEVVETPAPVQAVSP